MGSRASVVRSQDGKRDPPPCPPRYRSSPRTRSAATPTFLLGAAGSRRCAFADGKGSATQVVRLELHRRKRHQVPLAHCDTPGVGPPLTRSDAPITPGARLTTQATCFLIRSRRVPPRSIARRLHRAAHRLGNLGTQTQRLSGIAGADSCATKALQSSLAPAATSCGFRDGH
jgi:hypothetical protein